MRFEFSGCCFRITLEFFWLEREPMFRRYRITPSDATIRRKLMRAVRERLTE